MANARSSELPFVRASFRIFVCGLDEMPERVAQLRPARLISLLPPREQPPTPGGILPANHLRLEVDDVKEPHAGAIAPARTHIESLVEFLRASRAGSSLLFHCLAGVSRSPAAALVTMVLDAPGRELEAAKILREAAPFVDPNRLIIELADEVLSRSGRLVAALKSIGPPDLSCALTSIALPPWPR